MKRIAIALLVLLSSLARGEPPAEQWFTVLLDGRKIGSFHSLRDVNDDLVTTRQALELVLERNGTQIVLVSDETSTETRAGAPLGFRSRTRLSDEETRVEGTIRAGTLSVRTHSDGGTRERTLAWPAGALLPEGLRLAGLAAGLAPGTHWRSIAFQPSSLDAVTIDNRVGTPAPVELPHGRRALVPITQTIEYRGASVRSQAWVDAVQTLHKLTMPMLGVELTLLACDRACANAPNQSSDVFANTLVSVPRALSAAQLDAARYVLRSRDDQALPDLPETDAQRPRRIGDTMQVDVRRDAQDGIEAAPVAADRAPNDWLQSDHPELVELARRGVGAARGDAERMRNLEAFVRGYIRDKNLGVGYASALEVARNPEGDCTEHALLLAALGRAAGVATRVVNGIAYAPGFAGREHVFVPHAWIEAYVDGRWRGYDAALAGFDAGHVALAIGDGDPLRFYEGIAALGRIDIVRVEALEAAR